MKIPRMVVVSSQVASVGHHAETKQMDVEFRPFKAGRPNVVYRYQNVPTELYADILAADSIGRMINSTVKADPKSYPYRKLETEEAEQ